MKEPKTIETLVDDMYAVLDSRNDHTVDEVNVQAAGEALKDILRDRFKSREAKRGEGVIRFSSLGKQPRQLWYSANMPETAEAIPPKTMGKFLFGDMIELMLIFLAKEAGHEVTHEQHEVEVDGVFGHTDCMIDGIPVDVKSASPYSFKKFQEGGLGFDDPFGYISQISGYAHALGRTDKAGFLAMDKVAGDLCYSPVDQMTLEGNPPGPRIAKLKAVVNAPTPPPRCYEPVPDGKSGNMKLGVACSYCSYKFECHKDANGGEGLKTYFYSRGPVFLSRVVREPKVEAA